MAHQAEGARVELARQCHCSAAFEAVAITNWLALPSSSSGGRSRTCTRPLNRRLPYRLATPEKSGGTGDSCHRFTMSSRAPSENCTRVSCMASRWVTTTPWALVDLLSCQRAEHCARIELASLRYDGSILPLDEQCLLLVSSVGSEGLEPSPPWLRATYAAANTLIPLVAIGVEGIEPSASVL
jgi:hypothetical protein